MSDTEKIITKIKKVLELSKNNPSTEEAKSAALKAQRLMAEYHISINDINEIKDIKEITEERVVVGMGNKWKYALASIIVRNFRCKSYCYGKDEIAFYGYDVDAKIAAETFKYLFEIGNKSANKFYNQKRIESKKSGIYFDGSGIKNYFLAGYLQGILDVLDKQCTALMIVVPKEVDDGYKKKTQGCRKINNKLSAKESRYKNEAMDEGNRTGKNAVNNKRIENV